MEKMNKALRHLLLLCFIFAGQQVTTTKELSKDAKAVAKWVKKTQSANPKVTHLNFYLHENITSNHPTALPIAESSITNKLATGFGKLFMFEDSLTSSINSSTIIGYARGLFGSASQTEIGLVMAMNFVFTDGKFKGSTLVLVGYNDAMVSPREIPISGGTGVFRLARGVATLKTVFLNTTSFDSIIEYNIVVMHY